MPSLQQIRYLVALSDHLHFRRAAEVCHVTQPTLSAQVKEMEARLGTQLVERSRSGVILTETGRKIAERGRSVLRDVEEIRSIARAAQSPLASVLRVGVVQSLGSYFLPLIVPDLHEKHPKLGLYVREGLPEDLLRALEEGTLDLLFFPMPLARADFETISIFKEPIHVVAPKEHRLADERVIDPTMLRGETILSLERGDSLYEQVREICDTYGASLSHDFEGTSLDTLRQMVATGMGISLMPALYVRSEVAPQDIVVARPFRDTAPSRTIGVIWRGNAARADEFRLLTRLIRDSLRKVSSEIIVLG